MKSEARKLKLTVPMRHLLSEATGKSRVFVPIKQVYARSADALERRGLVEVVERGGVLTIRATVKGINYAKESGLFDL